MSSTSSKRSRNFDDASDRLWKRARDLLTSGVVVGAAVVADGDLKNMFDAHVKGFGLTTVDDIHKRGEFAIQNFVQLQQNQLQLQQNQIKLQLQQSQIKLEEYYMKTLYGALTRVSTDSLSEHKLECIGPPQSHLNTKHTAAETGDEKDFETGHIQALDVFKNHISKLMTRLIENSKIQYSNEYDVQVFVGEILDDAVRICNLLIKNAVGQSSELPVNLVVRREASIFSNVVDHAVVYDTLSRIPVFCSETKKPLVTNSDKEKGFGGKVYGQVFDQEVELKANGHPNPIGMLSTFEKTRICWIRTNTSGKVIDDHNKVGSFESFLEWVKGIAEGLRRHCSDDEEILSSTQSPIREQNPGKEAIEEAPFEFTATDRKLDVSREFNFLEVLPAVVHAILCSLVGFNKAKAVDRLRVGLNLEKVIALKLIRKSYEWGELTVQIKGMYKRPRRSPFPSEFYCIDFLGSGSTSRAYRAVTKDGFVCVVKIYVRRQDDEKKYLKDAKFKEMAKKAVNREKSNFLAIYGNDLERRVFTRKLNGLHCLIHPYFTHIQDRTDTSVIQKVEKLLREKFAKRKLKFKKDDIGWRHVGMFNDEIYLFDLADLEPLKESEVEEYVQEHCQILRNHASGS